MKKQKHPTSFRLSERTAKQLVDLVNITGNTRTELIEIAIDRMWIVQKQAQADEGVKNGQSVL